MGGIVRFLKDWMLPVAIITGILLYLAMRFIGPLAVSVEPGFSRFAGKIQPVLVAVMLFLQFNKVSPHDLKLKKWHIWLLAFQGVMFVALALAATAVPHGEVRILLECAMLCFVCPTAAAAGVITDKLGGSLSDTVTYVVLINVLAAFIIPLVIPMVHPAEGASFWGRFAAICMRVFPLLVLPLLLAWFVRFVMPGLHRWLLRFVGWAFYVWGFTLGLSIYLATKALLNSGISVGAVGLICLVSLACTAIQFFIGRRAGMKAGRGGSGADEHACSITAGQALGQKNTGFLIWLGYSWMTPVSSVAGGLYAIWQNLFNSAELYEQRHRRTI